MSTAIIALTYKRVDQTRASWANNLVSPYPVYWWDNTPPGAEREQLIEIAKNYNVVESFHDGSNYGIAHPINRMAERIFAAGHDGFVTMACDMLEPSEWITARETICNLLNAGIAAIPPYKLYCNVTRYARKEINGIAYEDDGDIIGNWYVAKWAYEMLGPYPEYYGIYGPIDLEYCARARKKGVKYVYLSDMECECLPCDNDDTEYTIAKNVSLANAWPIYSNIISNL